MTILYDHQAFTMQAYGGISRYYAEIIKEFQHTRQLQVRLSLISGQNENLPLIEFTDSCNYPFKKRIDLSYLYREQVNKFCSRFIIARGKFDIFHPTYYDPYFLGALKKKPFVLTVHDTIHEKFGYRYPGLTGNMHSVNDKSRLLNAASAIISVSANTKADLISLYGINESRISVVPLASPDFGYRKKPSPAELDSSEKYLLYVGNRDAYKNFNFFVRSIAGFLLKSPDCMLVCAGGGYFTDAEQLFFRTMGLENSIRFHPLNDNVLPLLYSQALAFVFPSLYEGFGIPVLEAMANNCPCVLSAAGSLPEVAEDAALYFDPEHSASILNAVETIVYDAALRKRLRIAGSKRLQFFSWQRTGDLTRQVYNKLY